MSEPNGQGTDSSAALRQLAEEVATNGEAAASTDPWFAPAPKPHGYQPLDSDAMDAAGWPTTAGNGQDSGAAGAPAGEATAGAATAAGAEASLQTQDAGVSSRPDEWFLRTGRAGLLPDSVSEIWDDEDTHVFARPDTASAPPWAGDQQAQAVDEPPPWESGPWPGPGEERPARPPRSAGGPQIRRKATDDAGNWQATAALGTGILPLVLPGAVLGVLGLRRARTSGTGQLASWIGIALSAIWAVILIVLLASGGSSGPNCSASSQAAVSGAVSTVLRDLGSSAPRSAVTADLQQAMSEANAAAAGAQQVSVRTAYVTLTDGLDRALATVQGGHSTSSYPALSSELSADNAAITSACKG
jgi:hypothetical protein